MGLTPLQIDEVRSTMRDIDFYGTSPGADGSFFILVTGDKWPPSDADVRLRGLLGEDGFRRREEYGKTVNAREFAVQIASALYLSIPAHVRTGGSWCQL